MRIVRVVLVSVALAWLAPAAHAALVASVLGGVPCVTGGVGQICSSSGTANRVETWDGVPLDVAVFLPPPSLEGPFPLIVDLHGFGAGKTPSEIEEMVPDGYVVLIYSARGQHFSCGFPESRQFDPTLSQPDACNDHGWMRLADARYEVHDTQYLAGRLLDEGGTGPLGEHVPLVRPGIGVTGVSFGGGQSLMLAVLKNRIMMTTGELVPWKSPGTCPRSDPPCGVDMSIVAAAPLIGWSDLAYALVPNGRTLDYRTLNPYFVIGLMERAGVMKKSIVDALYDAGVPTAFYAPAGADPDADVTAWKARLDQGDPYDADPLLRHAVDELTMRHSGYYLLDLDVDATIPPAPLFIYDAFTDDIMPFDEALRFWRKAKAKYPAAEISLRSEDGFAHPRGSLGSSQHTPLYMRVMQHLAWHLKGMGSPVPAIETFTQACGTASVEGPFNTAADWDALHPGEVRLADATQKMFDWTGGDSTNAMVDDPIAGGPTACRTVPTSDDDPGAATYSLAVVPGCDFTLMGSPTVIADLTVSDVSGTGVPQIVARLWDVAPDGSQTWVTHGLYRPRLDNLGPQVFQMHPNGWHFLDGHTAKLELLGQSSPYGLPPNGPFTITASNLELRLPVLEMPESCAAIQDPAPLVFPPTAPELAPTTTTITQPGTTTTSTTLPVGTQTVLGRKFQVKNLGSDAQRKILGRALERSSNDTIVGDPVANGGSLEVIANGGTSSDQTFGLPKEGWRRIGGIGFRYSNARIGGAVRKASIKRTTSGVFQVKVLVLGRDDSVTVVPPNPGTDGGFILSLAGGSSYCVAFGGTAGGTSVRNDATQWSIRNPSAEVCPSATASTTTTVPGSTTTTATFGTTTTSAPGTSTTTTTVLPGTTTTTMLAATTTTTSGATTTTTTTLPFQQCGVFPQCGGSCPSGQVCSVVFAEPPPLGEAGCVCVTGTGPCGGLECGGDKACPEGTTCQVNQFGGQCACFQTP